MFKWNKSAPMLEWNKPASIRIGNIVCKHYLFDKTKPVVVSFSHQAEGIDRKQIRKNPSPWAFDYLVAKNINVVSFSFITDKFTYYRDPDLFSAIPYISDALKVFPERLGYGISAGGYAISAFSNALNIDRVLLLCPISTRKKEINTWDFEAKRYLESFAFDWTGPYADGADSNSKGYVIYDPLHKLDRLHAERYTNMTKLKLPGAGHLVPLRLERLKMLSWTVNKFLSGSVPVNEFHLRGRARKNLLDYYTWMLSSQNERLSPARARMISASIPEKIRHQFYNANLSALGGKLKPHYKPADILRDIALIFERGGDRVTALTLMEKAHHLRPEGSLIRKKYEDLKR